MNSGNPSFTKSKLFPKNKRTCARGAEQRKRSFKYAAKPQSYVSSMALVLKARVVKLKVTLEMSVDWIRLCRLCGLNDGSGIKLDTLVQVIVLAERYFTMKLHDNNESPTPVCNDCVEFLMAVQKFAERCVSVDKMFADHHLANDKANLDIDPVRDTKSKETHIDSVGPVENNCWVDRVLHIDIERLPVESMIVKQEIDDNAAEHSSPRTLRCKTENIDCDSSSSNRCDSPVINKASDSEYRPSSSKRSCKPSKITVRKRKVSRRRSRVKDDSRSENSDEAVNESKDRKQKVVTKNRYAETKSKVMVACSPCQLSFDQPAQYAKHMRDQHTVDELPLACTQCPKRFAIPLQLRLHERRHLPADMKFKYPCSHCDKKFTKAHTVKEHVRACHLRLRPFVCEHCGGAYATKGALNDHKLTHTDERKFACLHCPKMFKSIAKAKEHKEAIHSNTKFSCMHCDALLNTKKSLRMHMLVHTDETRFKCQYCGKGYKRSNALKSHLILHTGQRPFACPFCDKTYASSSNCYNHKKKCHPDEFAATKATAKPSAKLFSGVTEQSC